MVDSGRSDRRTPMVSAQAFKLLFVCAGNDARSPLAEAFASTYLSQNGHGVKIDVSSAGLEVIPGGTIRQDVARVASGFGFDLTGWRSRPLTPDLCREHDLILTMCWEQVSAIWSLVPEVWDRSFTVKEFIHYAKQARQTPPIMFPDRTSQMRDRVRKAQALRKRARSDLGFWGGLRPEELDLPEPELKDEAAWGTIAQAIRALVTDSIRLVGAP